MNRRVKTENGWVRGLPASDPRITSFKGIPYAAPPVGKNRWRAPQPCADWTEERKAFEFGPIGMQDRGKPGRENFWSREWAVDFDLPMSEDCLYLNIWAPADGYAVGAAEQYRETEDTSVVSPGNLPVYIWFFGGGLQVGNTAEMEFVGERIARRGVVVVTVNYRLNVFGFMAHPELTAEDPAAPANFGFWDQQYAIQWVKRNITAFGGDPENITIGGQSSGGMSVCVQMGNPSNRGLFQKAILESAIFFPVYSNGRFFHTELKTGEAHGIAFLEKLGVHSIEQARQIDGETILAEALKMPPHFFDAVIDGAFVKGPANEWFMQPGHVICPLFMTFTDIEMIMSPSQVTSRKELRQLAESLDYVDVERFMAAFGSADDTDSIQEAGKVSGIELAAHAISRYIADEAPLWLGQFSAEIPGWDHPGCFHSSDLWFYFENLAKCWRPFRGKHYDLSRQMCDYWTNFIRSGDPNGLGSDGYMLPDWPKLTRENPKQMCFGETALLQEATPSPIMDVLLDAYSRMHPKR